MAYEAKARISYEKAVFFGQDALLEYQFGKLTSVTLVGGYEKENVFCELWGAESEEDFWMVSDERDCVWGRGATLREAFKQAAECEYWLGSYFPPSKWEVQAVLRDIVAQI